MLACNPQFRIEDDTKEFGDQRFLSPKEIEDAVEYVSEISRQQANQGGFGLRLSRTAK